MVVARGSLVVVAPGSVVKVVALGAVVGVGPPTSIAVRVLGTIQWLYTENAPMQGSKNLQESLSVLDAVKTASLWCLTSQV